MPLRPAVMKSRSANDSCWGWDDGTMPWEYSWMIPLYNLCRRFPASGSSFRSFAESFCVNQSDVLKLVRDFSCGIWHERVEVSSVLLGLSLTHKDVLFHGMLIPLFLSGLLAVILCTSMAGMITRNLWYLWISLTEIRAFLVSFDLNLHPNTTSESALLAGLWWTWLSASVCHDPRLR